MKKILGRLELLRNLFEALKSRKRLFISSFSVLLVAGLFWHLVQSSTVEISAVFMITKSVSSGGEFQDPVSTLLPQYLEMLKSPDFIKEILQSRGISLDPSEIIANIEVVPRVESTNYLSIKLKGYDASLIRRFMNRYIEAILERSTQIAQKNVDELMTFLQQKISEVQENLSKIEDQLSRFQEFRQSLSPIEDLKQSQDNLKKKRTELVSIEIEQQVMRSTLENLRPRNLRPRNRSAKAIKNFRNESARIDKHIIVLEAKGAILKNQINQIEKDLLVLSEKRQGYSALAMQQKTLEQTLGLLIERQNRALMEKKSGWGKLTLILATNVEPSVKTSFPGFSMLIVVAFLASVSAVFLAEHFDTSIRNPQSVRDETGLPMRGMIADLTACLSRESKTGLPLDNSLCTYLFSESPEAQSFHRFCEFLLNSAAEKSFQTMTIISPSEGTGGSTVAANTAIVLAKAGFRVILADADLINPSLHKKFRLNNRKGITTLLAGMPLESVLRSTPIETLKIITSGPLPPISSELFHNEEFGRIIELLKEQSDYLIFDVAPLKTSSDALILVPKIDRVFLLAGLGYSDFSEISESAELLSGMQCRVYGVLYNRTPINKMECKWESTY